MSCLKDFYRGQADQVAKKLEALRPKSAWSKGVIGYADILLTRYKDDLMVCKTPKPYSLELALCGASNWLHFSEGGMGLGYPNRICEALMPPSQAKKCMHKDGPNRYESWYGVEARALNQAHNLLVDLFLEVLVTK
jgi:hypothetical protein